MTDSHRNARREVTLPAAALMDLIGAVRGADPAALRAHGRAAGRLLADRLVAGHDVAPTPRALPADLFWKRVGEIFAGRGWGTLTPGPGDLGVGELRSTDWIEADRPDHTGSCELGVGLIAGLLEQASGAQFEVREVACRARGDAACRFFFGSAAAIDAATTHAATATQVALHGA